MEEELSPERDAGEKAKCGNCRYWNTDGQAGDGDVLENGEGRGNSGECCRLSPRLILAMDDVRLRGLSCVKGMPRDEEETAVNGSRAVWPITYHWNWCGEWQAAAKKVVIPEVLAKKWERPDGMPVVTFPETETWEEGYHREKRFAPSQELLASVRQEMRKDGASQGTLDSVKSTCSHLIYQNLCDLELDITDEEWQRRRKDRLSTTPTNQSLLARAKFLPTVAQLLQHCLASFKQPRSKKYTSVAKTLTRLLAQP